MSVGSRIWIQCDFCRTTDDGGGKYRFDERAELRESLIQGCGWTVVKAEGKRGREKLMDRCPRCTALALQVPAKTMRTA